MSMTDSGLSAIIKSKIQGLYGVPTSDHELQIFCDALGAAIVEYIQSNATVTVSNVRAGTDSATGIVS